MGLAGNRSLTAPCDARYPYTDLAASVVVKALQDWNTYGHETDCDIGDAEYRRVITGAGYASPQEELIGFFRGERCQFLVGGFKNVSYDAMMEELQKWGLPR